jgi:hypothetical protein
MDLRTFSRGTDVHEGESPASFGMIFLVMAPEGASALEVALSF